MDSNNFVRICLRLGRNLPFWTQGAGGNVSCKERVGDQDLLFIKASGVRLGEVTSQNIAVVDLSKFLKGFAQIRNQSADRENLYADLLKQSAKSGRPSMETGFHALLSGKWILHFHSLAAILMIHFEKKNPRQFENLLKKTDLKIQRVGPLRPGLLLSEELANQSASVFLLENHGVILSDDDPSVLDRWSAFEDLFMKSCFAPDGFLWKSLSLEDTIRHLPNPIQGTLPIYFPDTAVFRDEILSLLDKVDLDGWSISHERALSISKNAGKEKDALEIWLATRILNKLDPDLPSLSESLAAEIPNLPTEVFRKGSST